MTSEERTALFRSHRAQVHAIAYRMLGSATEADDVVQETWLRLQGTDPATIENPAGWFTTVVSRICLNQLRSREYQQQLAARLPAPEPEDPETEAELIDEVGRALLVVLGRLGPAERVAFVLHDLFAVPFEQIALVLDRSRDAAKQLASRARRRVRGAPVATSAPDRRLVAAFLDAARGGDLQALLGLLAPDVVRTVDTAGAPQEVHGVRDVLDEIAVFGRRARFADLVLIDGAAGIAVAPHGTLQSVLTVTVSGGTITRYSVIADPEHLAALDIRLVPS
ncbi:MAG TPA: sigma-70 family RNA polymerase sigma factor [Mycobacteriales bacterium]|nr:sigma-70 family RNA polymerase sigma factor [Mycobacteriales bacterium]